MVAALAPLSGVRTMSGVIHSKARPNPRISLLLCYIAFLLVLLPVIQAISPYSTGDVAVLDAFEQDLALSLFVDDESHGIDMDVQVVEDLDPSFLSLHQSSRFMASTSTLDAVFLGKAGEVTVSDPKKQDYKVCAALDVIQNAKVSDDAKMKGDVSKLGFTVSYADENVVLFFETSNTADLPKMYSYSRITGITHSSPLTKIILYVKQFHEEFVPEYEKIHNNPAGSTYRTVREILFAKPITLKLSADKSKVEIYTDTKTVPSKPVFTFPTKLTADQLDAVAKYFTDMLSSHYSASAKDFKDVFENAKAEHSERGINTVGKHYDIRVASDGVYANVQKTSSGYKYFTDGLDEIHRCMHQGVYLIRAFCDPFTGVVNDGPFTKSTLFAVDYMRIPTGQTLLDREISSGKISLHTHVTSKPSGTSLTIATENVPSEKGSTAKSIEFHKLRTQTAFSWDPVDMATYVQAKNNIKDTEEVKKLTKAFQLPQVHDRMNGYCEELASVALTLNPEALIKEMTESFNDGTITGTAPTLVATEKEVEQALEKFLKIPLGTNTPRANMRKRVKDGVLDVAKMVCRDMGWTSDDDQVKRLYDILIRKTTEEALRRMPQLLDKPLDSDKTKKTSVATQSLADDKKKKALAADRNELIARTTASFRADSLSAGSVSTLSRTSSDAMTDSESDDDVKDVINGNAPSLTRSSSVSLPGHIPKKPKFERRLSATDPAQKLVKLPDPTPLSPLQAASTGATTAGDADKKKKIRGLSAEE